MSDKLGLELVHGCDVIEPHVSITVAGVTHLIHPDDVIKVVTAQLGLGRNAAIDSLINLKLESTDAMTAVLDHHGVKYTKQINETGEGQYIQFSLRTKVQLLDPTTGKKGTFAISPEYVGIFYNLYHHMLRGDSLEPPMMVPTGAVSQLDQLYDFLNIPIKFTEDVCDQSTISYDRPAGNLTLTTFHTEDPGEYWDGLPTSVAFTTKHEFLDTTLVRTHSRIAKGDPRYFYLMPDRNVDNQTTCFLMAAQPDGKCVLGTITGMPPAHVAALLDLKLLF